MDSPLSLLLSGVKVYIPLGLVAYYIITSYLSYRRLAHIPGPWLARWSSLWLVRAMWRKESHLEFHGVAQKYGEDIEHQALERPLLIAIF